MLLANTLRICISNLLLKLLVQSMWRKTVKKTFRSCYKPMDEIKIKFDDNVVKFDIDDIKVEKTVSGGL